MFQLWFSPNISRAHHCFFFSFSDRSTYTYYVYCGKSKSYQSVHVQMRYPTVQCRVHRRIDILHGACYDCMYSVHSNNNNKRIIYNYLVIWRRTSCVSVENCFGSKMLDDVSASHTNSLYIKLMFGLYCFKLRATTKKQHNNSFSFHWRRRHSYFFRFYNQICKHNLFRYIISQWDKELECRRASDEL